MICDNCYKEIIKPMYSDPIYDDKSHLLMSIKNFCSSACSLERYRKLGYLIEERG